MSWIMGQGYKQQFLVVSLIRIDVWDIWVLALSHHGFGIDGYKQYYPIIYQRVTAPFL